MCITEYIMQILIIITDNIYIYIYIQPGDKRSKNSFKKVRSKRIGEG